MLARREPQVQAQHGGHHGRARSGDEESATLDAADLAAREPRGHQHGAIAHGRRGLVELPPEAAATAGGRGRAGDRWRRPVRGSGKPFEHRHQLACTLHPLGRCRLPAVVGDTLQQACEHFVFRRPLALDGRRVAHAQRVAAREHLGKEDAERIDVGTRVHLLAHELLRRHIRRRADHRARARQLGVPGEAGAVQPRDAEIDDLGTAGRQQDVLGLEIAMHDTGFVRGAQALRDLQRCGVDGGDVHRAVVDDGPQRAAVDELRRQEQMPFHLLERIHGGDRRVGDGGRGTGLTLQPFAQIGVVRQRRGQRLERHVAVQPAVCRQVNDAHPAASDLPDDLELADPITGVPDRRFVHGVWRCCEREILGIDLEWALEEPSQRVVRVQQLFRRRQQRCVAAAFGAQPGRAFAGRTLERAVEDALDLTPALRRHAPSSACLSHARAIAHCRLTVAGETPTASAVSSTVRPPK